MSLFKGKYRRRWCDSHAAHKTHNKRCCKNTTYKCIFSFGTLFTHRALCSIWWRASQRLTTKPGIFVTTQPPVISEHPRAASSNLSRARALRRSMAGMVREFNSHFLLSFFIFSLPVRISDFLRCALSASAVLFSRNLQFDGRHAKRTRTDKILLFRLTVSPQTIICFTSNQIHFSPGTSTCRRAADGANKKDIKLWMMRLLLNVRRDDRHLHIFMLALNFHRRITSDLPIFLYSSMWLLMDSLMTDR